MMGLTPLAGFKGLRPTAGQGRPAGGWRVGAVVWVPGGCRVLLVAAPVAVAVVVGVVLVVGPLLLSCLHNDT